MSNVLKVSLQTTIYSLADRGWSQRRIASELGINRETVRRYLRLAKPAISIAGSEEEADRKPAISITGDGAGRRSRCESLAEVIGAKLEVGLSARRIYQDLVEQNDFRDSYQSVQRFVCKLKATQPRRVWRMEARPGEEVQVDFALGAPIEDGASGSRRSWIFRMVLSYSRKAYSEAVLRQDTETFLRCLENGLRAFGGVPLLLNLDNLKAAVLKADWFDPEINPKLADFCRHYGLHVMPCRPYKPRYNRTNPTSDTISTQAGACAQRTAMPNSPGVSARSAHNSHPAKTAVAAAVRAKSRLARASCRRHQTSRCTNASVRQADAIIAQMMVTQLMAFQWLRVRRRLNELLRFLTSL
jgi:transposase